jgi:RNA polymerase sigma factor (sigma-70 family)
VTPAEQFLANLALIERIIAYTSVRHRLSKTDRDEFASYARLELIEDDYRPLRLFNGRSKLSTYLTTVIARLYLDFRIRQWGKWRPSSEARRLGPLAIQLERLLTRDRLTREEAFEQLRSGLPDPPSWSEIEELCARLPLRVPRQMVSDEVLSTMAATDPPVERELLAAEGAARWTHALAALKRAIDQLDPIDQAIIRLRYQDGMTVPNIATMVHLEAKPLYRRLERLHEQLRLTLERAGVSAAEIHELLIGRDDPLPATVLRGSGPPRPSH